MLLLKIFICLDSIQTRYEALFKFPSVIRFPRVIAMLLDLLKLFQSFLLLIRALLSLSASTCSLVSFNIFYPTCLQYCFPHFPSLTFPLISSWKHNIIMWNSWQSFLIPFTHSYSLLSVSALYDCTLQHEPSHTISFSKGSLPLAKVFRSLNLIIFLFCI